MISATAILLLAAGVASAATSCQTWYDTTQHGKGFRNVMTYGAKGDGVTDDTAAIYAALTDGRSPVFTTTDPTVVYFPPGTYLLRESPNLPLPVYFYTFVTGSWCDPPTILLAPGSYNGYVFDSDAGDDPNSEHTDDFLKGFSNMNVVIGAGNLKATGIHWAQSQGTHVRNVTFDLTAAGQTAMFMENGSGGWISDVVVKGGQTGLSLGNQQWSLRSVTVTGSVSNCIYFYWNWAFTFVDLHLSNCPVGIFAQTTSLGSLMLLDSSMTNVGTGILTSYPNSPFTPGILLERFTATNVPTITNQLQGKATGVVVLPSWVQGTVFVNDTLVSSKQTATPLTRADAPLSLRPRPWNPPGGGAVVNVYTYGAKGDGVTDDTAAILAAIAAQPQGGAVFLPQGSYLLTATLTLRADTYLIGEALSALIPSPAAALWSSATSPTPVVLLPQGGSCMLAGLLFTTTGAVPGAVMLQWSSGVNSGSWDVHWRVLHTTWAMTHIVGSTAGGTMENSWLWVADHDINTGANLNVSNPRGMLVEAAQGPLFLYGVAAEHSQQYQFKFTGAANVVQLIAQTETPYNQMPTTAPGYWWVDSSNMHLYGGAIWDWNCNFYPGQAGCNSTSLITWDNTSGAMFGLNTHGADAMVSGDVTIPANGPPTMNWFTSLAMAIIQQDL